MNLFSAITHNDKKSVEELLSQMTLEKIYIQENQCSALMFAVKNINTDCVRMILARISELLNLNLYSYEVINKKKLEIETSLACCEKNINSNEIIEMLLLEQNFAPLWTDEISGLNLSFLNNMQSLKFDLNKITLFEKYISHYLKRRTYFQNLDSLRQIYDLNHEYFSKALSKNKCQETKSAINACIQGKFKDSHRYALNFLNTTYEDDPPTSDVMRVAIASLSDKSYFLNTKNHTEPVVIDYDDDHSNLARFFEYARINKVNFKGKNIPFLCVGSHGICGVVNISADEKIKVLFLDSREYDFWLDSCQQLVCDDGIPPAIALGKLAAGIEVKLIGLETQHATIGCHSFALFNLREICRLIDQGNIDRLFNAKDKEDLPIKFFSTEQSLKGVDKKINSRSDANQIFNKTNGSFINHFNDRHKVGKKLAAKQYCPVLEKKINATILHKNLSLSQRIVNYVKSQDNVEESANNFSLDTVITPRNVKKCKI